MKTKTLILSIVTILTATSLFARVKIPVCFPCEKIETVLDLTKDENLTKMANNNKVNLSYLNNEYGLLWTSIWNSNGRFVLTNTAENMYWEIDDTIAQYLKETHNFDIKTAKNPLSFWKKIGGKIAFVIVIGLLIYGNINSKEEEETEPTNV